MSIWSCFLTFRKFQYIVSDEYKGVRLDKFCTLQFESRQISRSQIAQCIRNGQVKINGTACLRPSFQLSTGDSVELNINISSNLPEPVFGELDIKWQDEDIIILNKPAGLSVHPASSNKDNTLVHYLLYHFPFLGSMDSLRPGIVHRLDKDTSGLMIVALTEQANKQLKEDIASRFIDKQYLVLVHGRPEKEEGEIRYPLARDPRHKTKMAVQLRNGREAVTIYKLMYIFPEEEFSLLKVKLVTGRTHQIRVHLAYIGHPVLGDSLYGGQQEARVKKSRPLLAKLARRQMLHAWRVSLSHPINQNDLFIQQTVPKDFYQVLLYLFKRVQRVGVTGTVGSGKSVLTRLVAGNDYPVWSADKAVEELYQPGHDGWEMLRRHFGEKFFQSTDGAVDKVKLFQAMQDSEEIRNEVLKIIHPLAEYKLGLFWQEHKFSRVALAEVPLLIEAGWHKKRLFDVCIGVYCPQEWRRKWLKENRKWEDNLISKMESWQLSEKDKLKEVDLVVSNPGDWLQLKYVAKKLRSILTWLRRQRIKRFYSKLKDMGVV